MSEPWPRIGIGRTIWLPNHDAPMSRRRRQRNQGEFEYAIAPRIAELEVRLEPRVEAAARAAMSLIERFDTQAEAWGPPFASVLLRSESASSSQIERLSASARRVALATLGDQRNRNATSIARNVRAMQAAIALSDEMDSKAVLAMHRALGGGDDPANAGCFREEWVWVGGESPVTAAFVPPRHEDVPEAVEDVMRFLRRTDLEPLTQAAIGHAQFETIHPFTDGNGRTGRALVSSVLRHRRVATNMTVPISSGLLTDTAAYFDALTSYRNGDPGPIIEQLAEAAEQAIANAATLRTDVEAVREAVLATAQRRTRNLTIMAGLCAVEPAFDIEMVVEAGIARPSAYRLCQRLTDAGLLRREPAIRGVDAWTVVGLTEALDDFAVRSGRRG